MSAIVASSQEGVPDDTLDPKVLSFSFQFWIFVSNSKPGKTSWLLVWAGALMGGRVGHSWDGMGSPTLRSWHPVLEAGTPSRRLAPRGDREKVQAPQRLCASLPRLFQCLVALVLQHSESQPRFLPAVA